MGDLPRYDARAQIDTPGVVATDTTRVWRMMNSATDSISQSLNVFQAMGDRRAAHEAEIKGKEAALDVDENGVPRVKVQDWGTISGAAYNKGAMAQFISNADSAAEAASMKLQTENLTSESGGVKAYMDGMKAIQDGALASIPKDFQPFVQAAYQKQITRGAAGLGSAILDRDRKQQSLDLSAKADSRANEMYTLASSGALRDNTMTEQFKQASIEQQAVLRSMVEAKMISWDEYNERVAQSHIDAKIGALNYDNKTAYSDMKARGVAPGVAIAQIMRNTQTAIEGENHDTLHGGKWSNIGPDSDYARAAISRALESVAKLSQSDIAEHDAKLKAQSEYVGVQSGKLAMLEASYRGKNGGVLSNEQNDELIRAYQLLGRSAPIHAVAAANNINRLQESANPALQMMMRSAISSLQSGSDGASTDAMIGAIETHSAAGAFSSPVAAATTTNDPALTKALDALFTKDDVLAATVRMQPPAPRPDVTTAAVPGSVAVTETAPLVAGEAKPSEANAAEAAPEQKTFKAEPIPMTPAERFIRLWHAAPNQKIRDELINTYVKMGFDANAKSKTLAEASKWQEEFTSKMGNTDKFTSSEDKAKYIDALREAGNIGLWKKGQFNEDGAKKAVQLISTLGYMPDSLSKDFATDASPDRMAKMADVFKALRDNPILAESGKTDAVLNKIQNRPFMEAFISNSAFDKSGKPTVAPADAIKATLSQMAMTEMKKQEPGVDAAYVASGGDSKLLNEGVRRAIDGSDWWARFSKSMSGKQVLDLNAMPEVDLQTRLAIKNKAIELAGDKRYAGEDGKRQLVFDAAQMVLGDHAGVMTVRDPATGERKQVITAYAISSRNEEYRTDISQQIAELQRAGGGFIHLGQYLGKDARTGDVAAFFGSDMAVDGFGSMIPNGVATGALAHPLTIGIAGAYKVYNSVRDYLAPVDQDKFDQNVDIRPIPGKPGKYQVFARDPHATDGYNGWHAALKPDGTVAEFSAKSDYTTRLRDLSTIEASVVLNHYVPGAMYNNDGTKTILNDVLTNSTAAALYEKRMLGIHDAEAQGNDRVAKAMAQNLVNQLKAAGAKWYDDRTSAKATGFRMANQAQGQDSSSIAPGVTNE